MPRARPRLSPPLGKSSQSHRLKAPLDQTSRPPSRIQALPSSQHAAAAVVVPAASPPRTCLARARPDHECIRPDRHTRALLPQSAWAKTTSPAATAAGAEAARACRSASGAPGYRPRWSGGGVDVVGSGSGSACRGSRGRGSGRAAEARARRRAARTRGSGGGSCCCSCSGRCRSRRRSPPSRREPPSYQSYRLAAPGAPRSKNGASHGERSMMTPHQPRAALKRRRLRSRRRSARRSRGRPMACGEPRRLGSTRSSSTVAAGSLPRAACGRRPRRWA